MPTRRLCRAAAFVAAASSLALLPSASSARPHRARGPHHARGSHRITINAAPNPITAGDGVVIFGRLTGPSHQHRLVQLWHRLPGQPFFTRIQRTRTGRDGRYEFIRVAGVIDTTRSWYVSSDGAFSRRLREFVHAAITLRPLASMSLVTATPYTFTGTISPRHAGERVELQRKQPTGDEWLKIGEGRIGADGTYTIAHVFRYPADDPNAANALGDSDVRAHFRGDNRNIQSSSNSVSLQIGQKQNPSLSISASADPITIGQSMTVSGTVAAPNNAGMTVVLQSRTNQTAFANVSAVRTDPSGNYSFPNLAPVNNTLYRVTAPSQPKPSAALYVGVRDALTGTASASSMTAGQRVVFTGAVAPDKTGHVLYLERQNPRTGEFHIVQVAVVGAGSRFIITHRVVVPGSPAVFRLRIPGGPVNQGSATQPIPIQVAQNASPLS